MINIFPEYLQEKQDKRYSVSAIKTYPVRTQRCSDVYTTSGTLGQRRVNVKTTFCAYWVTARVNLSWVSHLGFVKYICSMIKIHQILFEILFYFLDLLCTYFVRNKTERFEWSLVNRAHLLHIIYSHLLRVFRSLFRIILNLNIVKSI